MRGGRPVIQLGLEGRVVTDALLAERVLRTSSLAVFGEAALSSRAGLRRWCHLACLLAAPS